MKHLLIAFLVISGCSSDAPAKMDAKAGSAFGATCTVVTDTGTECASGVCTDSFNMTTPLCSQKCTMLMSADPSCPSGSMGMKCNMKGYCRP